ncbi:hypothetical protein ACFQ6C_18560 [Streptomyces sp. NPDC056454]|uniref:hypothetical protein n=1 Tax=Streptomyces sp. NPDC056454 TaxID=3345823 RepID=UPI0036756CA5
MGSDRGGHDLVVQAGVAAAAAQDQGQVAADFSQQVPAVEAAPVVHHEHRRGDVDGRQRDVDRCRNPARIAAAEGCPVRAITLTLAGSGEVVFPPEE